MARFVLVHGAFAGAWCWDRVIGPLEAAGHSVEAIDLPGSGADATPPGEATLDGYVERICTQLASGDEPAILVGHSMGGVAITQAADRRPDLISLLVYVAAFLPRDGQSLIELTETPEGQGDQVQANLVVDGDPPVATLSPAAARLAVFGECDEEAAAWGSARVGAQGVAPFTAPVRLRSPEAAALPRAYVLCTRDQAIPPPLQRRMSAETPCTAIVEIDTDHSPWLSRPDELVAALESFVPLARAV